MRYDFKPSRLEGGEGAAQQAQGAGRRWWCSTRSAASSAPAACASWARWPRRRSWASSAAARTRSSTWRPARQARVELLGQHRRPLPGGRAAQPRLPLPRPRLVPVGGAVGVHRLLARLLDLRRLHGPGRLPLPARGRTRPINKSWMCDQGRLSYKALNTHRVPQSRGSAEAPTRRPLRRPRRSSSGSEAQALGGSARGGRVPRAVQRGSAGRLTAFARKTCSR